MLHFYCTHDMISFDGYQLIFALNLEVSSNCRKSKNLSLNLTQLSKTLSFKLYLK